MSRQFFRLGGDDGDFAPELPAKSRGNFLKFAVLDPVQNQRPGQKSLRKNPDKSVQAEKKGKQLQGVIRGRAQNHGGESGIAERAVQSLPVRQAGAAVKTPENSLEINQQKKNIYQAPERDGQRQNQNAGA